MKRSGNKALSTDQRKRQSERLIEAAREAGASEDEADFDEALKRIAKGEACGALREEKQQEMKGMLCSVAMLLIVFFAHPSSGSTVIGFGGQTCGKWLEDRGRGGADAALDEAWILGYLSAWNSSNAGAADGMLRNIDNAGIFAWIDGACSRHPLELIADAAGRLTAYLAKRIQR